MKTVVITGSTHGIGLGLAKSFLARGCEVVISGRSPATVEKAVEALGQEYESQRISGCACDVSHFDQLQALWGAAIARFGKVDIWINNAGIGHSLNNFWDIDAVELRAVVETNLLGAMFGSKVAMQGMLKQGYGAIYNVEGLGSGAQPKVKGVSVYGTTKAGLRYLNDALAAEAKGTPVVVGMIQPGMVATELLSRQYAGQPEEWEKAKRIFNIIADKVEVVTPWLADKVLANQKNGARINWSSNLKIFGRFIISPIQHRHIVD